MKKLQILGGGCARCETLYEMTEAAAKRLGIEYEMEKVTDLKKITDFGVMTTPALAVDGAVKVAGRMPTADEIEAMIGG
ncbi:MAG: TM0996/MTH895 family glutaredoxin-like protein [Deltaproteobacteria bacterium]|uniref:TM0996/MTH895 family glutaredoxin-like protein n=1 Tax=Candidatus Zymogenus saltonus TaxID=2844893 RepID=A0A9D8PPU4_9DELT|nr:TM0996/MTH895 family glutaredoxin-like protein [Candidatus Zymogenus saltonus]